MAFPLRVGWGYTTTHTGPKEGSNVSVVASFWCAGAVGVSNPFGRRECSFTAQQGVRGVDRGLLCVSKVVNTLEATSHLSASL